MTKKEEMSKNKAMNLPDGIPILRWENGVSKK